MTKSLEDFFNLPPTVKTVEEDDAAFSVAEKNEVISDAKELYSSLTTAEKVDSALPTVAGLDSHDSEMDSIARKAIDTFDDLIALGGNVPDMHAGKIYEVAGQMLKTALEAKNAKAEKKLRMIELQLKRLRAEQIDFENGNARGITPSGGEFDRNELIRHMVSSKSEKSDK